MWSEVEDKLRHATILLTRAFLGRYSVFLVIYLPVICRSWSSNLFTNRLYIIKWTGTRLSLGLNWDIEIVFFCIIKKTVNKFKFTEEYFTVHLHGQRKTYYITKNNFNELTKNEICKIYEQHGRFLAFRELRASQGDSVSPWSFENFSWKFLPYSP